MDPARIVTRSDSIAPGKELQIPRSYYLISEARKGEADPAMTESVPGKIPNLNMKLYYRNDAANTTG